VISLILHNLSEEFKAFTASITQSFRSNENAYSIDTLIAAIIDEAKRHKYRNQANTASLEPRKGKGGKKNSRVGKNSSWKKEKGQLCKIYNKPSHKSENCYLLHPEKAPKAWQKKFKKLGGTVLNASKKKREEKEEALLSRLAISNPGKVQEVDIYSSKRVIEEIESKEEEFEDVIMSDGKVN